MTAKHAAQLFVEQKVAGSIVLVASMSGQIANRVRLQLCFSSWIVQELMVITIGTCLYSI